MAAFHSEGHCFCQLVPEKPFPGPAFLLDWIGRTNPANLDSEVDLVC